MLVGWVGPIFNGLGILFSVAGVGALFHYLVIFRICIGLLCYLVIFILLFYYKMLGSVIFGILFSVGGGGVVSLFCYFSYFHWVVMPFSSFYFYFTVGLCSIFIHFGGVGVVYYWVTFSSVSWGYYTIWIVLLSWLPFIYFVGCFSFIGFSFFILFWGVGGWFIIWLFYYFH